MFLKQLTILFIFCGQLLLAPLYANTILVMGDSLSAAYNLKISEGWVALMESDLKQRNVPNTTINASVSGETSQGGAARFSSLVELHKPSIVILELGANDALRGYPLQRTQTNLEQMIQTSLAMDAKVLLIGNQIPPNYGRRYTEQFFSLYKNLSKQYPIEYIPFMLDKVALDENLMLEDGLHPNADGQKIVLQNIMPFLEPMLSK